ncbi:hypothetical protein [Marivirga sp.]|uniref:hypothetical protein n=1 Tax=Marivirga sp. TaxID=2018662 RepID=UPI002D808AB7|nr:hypothetical protein [Marivirga sp.]HET8858898.1 hypothetical protein [Marivirga sp.]
MKKNLITIALAIVSIASLAFGYSQKQNAEEQKVIVQQYSLLLDKKNQQLELMQKTSEEQMQLASQQLQISTGVVEECE